MERFGIDVERARREAKALLAEARRGERDALAQMRSDRAPRLADAQWAVARVHGFGSWAQLVAAERDLGAALRAAARTGDDDRVYELLEAGAPPNARDRRTGRTALHVAAAADQLHSVSALVGWVPADQHVRDRRNRTALDLARPGSPVAAVLASCSGHVARATPGVEHAERADAAEAALFEHVARAAGVEHRPVGDGYAFRTGRHDNTRNGVVCSRLDDASQVGDVLAWFVTVPAQWYVGPDGDPELRADLEAAGCRPERTAVHMAAPLDALDGAIGADVVEVSEAADLVHVDAPEAALLTAAGPPLRHFVIPGRAGITTFVHGTTLLGVHLTVLRAHRRRGLARVLVRHAIAVGRADGCTHAVLAPTPATVPFYERLGFALERSLPDRWYYLR